MDPYACIAIAISDITVMCSNCNSYRPSNRKLLEVTVGRDLNNFASEHREDELPNQLDATTAGLLLA
jgi:hypothetical protein